MSPETRAELYAALPSGDSWSTFAWPDWVPARVRDEIARFWSSGRGVAEWRRAVVDNYGNHPRFGQRVEVTEAYMHPRKTVTCIGRWVPAWGNMGRIVLDDGSWRVASTCMWRSADFIHDRDPGDEDRP